MKVYEPENREDEMYERHVQRKVDEEMQTKFCRDCVHFMENVDGIAHKCGRTGALDLVNGREIFNYCSFERAGLIEKDCGPDAQYFYPKMKAAA